MENQDRQTPCDESKQYLETTIFECVAPEYKLREIVDRPEGVDCNEWLAYHSKLHHITMFRSVHCWQHPILATINIISKLIIGDF